MAKNEQTNDQVLAQMLVFNSQGCSPYSVKQKMFHFISVILKKLGSSFTAEANKWKQLGGETPPTPFLGTETG